MAFTRSLSSSRRKEPNSDGVVEGVRRYFHFNENETNFRREMIAGATTFATMSYIIFVNPAILSAAGMDFGAVMVATCLAAATGTLLMGLLANYPIALAPGMGLNAYFAFSVCVGMDIRWEVALGAVFISGLAFMLLSLLKLRDRIIEAIPGSLKNAIAVGIGLLIAFVGFKDGGILQSSEATFVTLGNLSQPVPLITLFGVLITGTLLARRVVGALLLGIFITGLAAAAAGLLHYEGVFSAPPPVAPTFMKMDIAGTLELGLVTIIVVFLFIDMFDTLGTLVAVGEQGKFMREGMLPRAGRAFFSDGMATSLGALFGTSTTTAYIESAAGIAEGGRTGFANLVTAALFLLALFLAPLIQMLGQGVEVQGVQFHPVTAPALIIVGSLMVINGMEINWEDPTEAIPAFLTLLGIPLTFSIADGMAFGFISYPVIKVLSGRGREVNRLLAVLAIIFAARYFLI